MTQIPLGLDLEFSIWWVLNLKSCIIFFFSLDLSASKFLNLTFCCLCLGCIRFELIERCILLTRGAIWSPTGWRLAQPQVAESTRPPLCAKLDRTSALHKLHTSRCTLHTLRQCTPERRGVVCLGDAPLSQSKYRVMPSPRPMLGATQPEKVPRSKLIKGFRRLLRDSRSQRDNKV